MYTILKYKIVLTLLFNSFLLLTHITAQTSVWDSLYNYTSDSLMGKKRYDEAFIVATKNLKQAESDFGKNHQNYLNTVLQLGEILFYNGKYTEGASFLAENIEFVKHSPYRDSIYYGKLLNLLGVIYRNGNELGKAEKAYSEALQFYAKRKSLYLKQYNSCLNNLATLYERIGKIDEAINFLAQAVENTPKTDASYTTKQGNLAILYKNKGRFKEALQMAHQALLNTSKTDKNYIYRLHSLSLLYSDINLKEKALEYALQALAIVEQNQEKNSPNHSMVANDLAVFYNELNQYEKALPYALEAVKIEAPRKEQSTGYYSYLAVLAECYTHLSRWQEGMPLALEAVQKTAIKPGKMSQNYFNALGVLARTYEKKGDIGKTIELYQEFIDSSKTVWSETEDRHIKVLTYLVPLYNQQKQFDKSTTLLKKLASNMNKQVLYNLDVLDEYGKEIFINNFIKDYEPLLFSQIKNLPQPDKDLIKYAYEAELTIKGIILGSTQAFRQLVEKSKTTIDVNKPKPETQNSQLFIQWTALKEGISTAYTRKAPQNHIDSLNNQLSALEEQLMTQMPELKQINRKTIRYQDIKNKLAPGACAIEFVHFRYHDNEKLTDSVLYGALIARPNQTTPEFVYLCTENDLKTILINSKNAQQLYATRGATKSNKAKLKTKFKGTRISNTEGGTLFAQALHDLVWKPLRSYLDSVTTIYYAPSGLLHRVAFAALPTNETDVLSDAYKLHALSSTRELMQLDTATQRKIVPQNVLIYGGIRYEADSVALAKAYSAAPKNKIASNQSRSGEANIAWQYLDGTRRETERITALFKRKNVKIQVKKGFAASEDDFKNLTATAINSGVYDEKVSPSILHIATHGFFFPNPTENKALASAFQASNNPLIRSALVMAGANRVWLGNMPYAGREDGILTAYEISNMNLSGTKLVVLSACETGLGDIQGTEGVYGLQRAFKMAGVDYILMSLWQVPDRQTAELMEKFYTKLLDGASISSAFEQAQQAMKEKYPPYYWAGFVLMR